MNKRQRQAFADGVMLELAKLLPSWEARTGKFPQFQSAIRCKVVSANCLCFVAVTVAPPRGIKPETASISVGWTRDVNFDDSVAIEKRRPTALLSDLIEDPNAPEWSWLDHEVTLDRLKRRSGVFSGVQIEGSTSPSDMADVFRDDLIQYGIPFIEAMCRFRDLSFGI
jgi:hypothetical protein